MTKKKLTIILTFILLLLIGSGLAYYNTYNSLNKEISNTTAAIKENTSSILDTAVDKTNNDLKDSSSSTKSSAGTKDTKSSAITVGVENKDFKFITYTVQSGDTLFSIATNCAPSYTWDSVRNVIVTKNKLKDPSMIKAGDKLIIPEEIISSN